MPDSVIAHGLLKNPPPVNTRVRCVITPPLKPVVHGQDTPLIQRYGGTGMLTERFASSQVKDHFEVKVIVQPDAALPAGVSNWTVESATAIP